MALVLCATGLAAFTVAGAGALRISRHAHSRTRLVLLAGAVADSITHEPPTDGVAGTGVDTVRWSVDNDQPWIRLQAWSGHDRLEFRVGITPRLPVLDP